MPSKDTQVRIDKKLQMTVIFFVLLLVAAVILLVFVSRSEQKARGSDRYIRLAGQTGFNCEYAEAQKLFAFGEGVLKVTKERIAYLTLSGNEVYSKSVSYNNPQCFIKGRNCVVFDSDGYGFVVMNTDKVIYDKPTDNKIQSAVLSPSGMCAIITDSTDAYGEVIVYNHDGGQISRWVSYNSGYPICASFCDDESYFALSTLNTTGAVYKPYIRIFSLTNADNGVEVSDYAVFTVDDSQVFSYTGYIGSKLFVFCADTVYTIINDQMLPLNLSLGTVNYVRIVNDVIFIVYSDGVSQLNKLMIINSNGDAIYDSEVGSDVNAIAAADNLYALSVDNRILVYNTEGAVRSDVAVDEDIIRIGFTSNNRLVVVSTGGVHTVDY